MSTQLLKNSFKSMSCSGRINQFPRNFLRWQAPGCIKIYSFKSMVRTASLTKHLVKSLVMTPMGRSCQERYNHKQQQHKLLSERGISKCFCWCWYVNIFISFWKEWNWKIQTIVCFALKNIISCYWVFAWSWHT